MCLRVFVYVAQAQSRVRFLHGRVCGLKVSFMASIFGLGYFLESSETF